jgi:hypothetical protein
MLTATVKNHIFREENLREASKGGGGVWLRPGQGRTLQAFGNEGLAKQGMRWSDMQSVVAVFGEARGGGGS